MGPGIVAGLRGGTRPLGVLTGTGVSWIILPGCWAPFWTGTEKGELTRGSGWPDPPPRTDMLGAARGTSTFPGSSCAEPPEGVAWTGETDWALGGGAEGTDCRIGIPAVGAVAARTLPLVEVPGGRVNRMLVVGAGPLGAAALVPGACAGEGAT